MAAHCCDSNYKKSTVLTTKALITVRNAANDNARRAVRC